jgi:hypothetical protein
MLRFLIVILLLIPFDATAQEDAYSTPDDSMAVRSDLVTPALSFFLPGFGQWVSNQYGHAVTYSGIALLGVGYAGNASKDIDAYDKNNEDTLSSKNIAQRKMDFGFQTYQAAGGYSLFHSFRTAARYRQTHNNQYKFLESDPEPIDLAMAPFHFQFLKKPTTFIPLLLGAGLNYWIVHSSTPDGWVKDSFRREDAAFTVGFSYNAGTHEEAVFRGWLMPTLREYWMNDTWSNGIQATAFAAAHLNSTSMPIAQLLLGWHFGSITQKNKWDMREAIFIHAWWDVFAFAAQYHVKKQDPKNTSVARLNLPPLTYAF